MPPHIALCAFLFAAWNRGFVETGRFWAALGFEPPLVVTERRFEP